MPYATWSVASALSTLLTFLTLIHLPLYVSVIFILLAVVTFAMANFKLYRHQQSEIEELRQQVQALQHREPVTKLRIHRAADSRYILTPVHQMAHGDFNGGYFDFNLRVENNGERNSIVDKYAVTIEEFSLNFDSVYPEEPNYIQGRHCMHALVSQRYLSKTKLVKIEPYSSTEFGHLMFHLPRLNLETFADAGFRMQGEQHRFGSLHCRLTLTDSTGVSVSETFELRES